MNTGSVVSGPSAMAPTPVESAVKTRLVSIIIPVYNEFYHLNSVLDRVLAAPMPSGFEKELVIVDDGSVDGTTDLLKALCHPEIKTIHCVKNAGKGTAIRLGLEQASGEIIVIQDGDSEYNPAEIETLVRPIADGRAQVVYGSRFLGQLEGMRWPYWLVNKMLVAAVWILYGVHITDEATAYKAFHRDVIKNLSLECRRFEFCPEVTAKVIRRGIKIHEVPISYGARTVAEGKKIRFSDALMAFWTLLRYRWWR